jgi:hypothetical protein
MSDITPAIIWRDSDKIKVSSILNISMVLLCVMCIFCVCDMYICFVLLCHCNRVESHLQFEINNNNNNKIFKYYTKKVYKFSSS